MKHTPLSAELFIQNRANFVAQMESNSIAVFHSNHQYTANADLYFKFKQDTNLYYLTGIDQEKTILFLFPDCPSPEFREVLFVLQSNEYLQIWEGHKYDKQESTALSGIPTIKWLSEFQGFMDNWSHYADNIYISFNEHDRAVQLAPSQNDDFAKLCRKRYPAHNLLRSAPILTALRSIKSKWEVEAMQQACDITHKTFERVLKFVQPEVTEYEIEAEITHEFLRNRATGHAYNPIIASGKNSNILHYEKNNQVCKAGDLLLMDFGAEYAGYAADLSRTIPVSKKFTSRQKEVYNAVLATFNFAKNLLQVGNNFLEYNQQVGNFAEIQLIQLGLLDAEAVKKQSITSPLYKKYFMHNTSHYLGLDVHDVGNRFIPFEAGMVFTCEPGIYIPAEGFGIRIENDILITENGNLDLMANIPIEANHIEDIMNS